MATQNDGKGAHNCDPWPNNVIFLCILTNAYKCLQHVTILLYSTVFLDDDKVINKKVKKVLKEGLNPVLCIGETKEEYEAGLNREVCIHFVCSICKYICYVCILLVLVYMYTYIYVYIFYTVLCRIMYMRI